MKRRLGKTTVMDLFLAVIILVGFYVILTRALVPPPPDNPPAVDKMNEEFMKAINQLSKENDELRKMLEKLLANKPDATVSPPNALVNATTPLYWTNSNEDLLAYLSIAKDYPMYSLSHFNKIIIVDQLSNIEFRWISHNPYNKPLYVEYAVEYIAVEQFLSEFNPFRKTDTLTITGRWVVSQNSSREVAFKLAQIITLEPNSTYWVEARLQTPSWTTAFDKGAFIVRIDVYGAFEKDESQFKLLDSDVMPAIADYNEYRSQYINTDVKSLKSASKLLLCAFRFTANVYNYNDGESLVRTGPEWIKLHPRPGVGAIKLVEVKARNQVEEHWYNDFPKGKSLAIEVKASKDVLKRGKKFKVTVSLYRRDCTSRGWSDVSELYSLQSGWMGVDVPLRFIIPLEKVTFKDYKVLDLYQDMLENPQMYYLKVVLTVDGKIVDVVRVGLELEPSDFVVKG